MPGLSCTLALPPPETTIDGMSSMTAAYPRAVGTDCSRSRSSVRCCFAVCTSTTGLSPVTVMVSSSPPTLSSAFSVATKSAGRTNPSRLTVPNPGSVNVTV